MNTDFNGSIAEQRYEAWQALWGMSHEAAESGPRLRAWPDGSALLKTPAIVVSTFQIITAAVVDELRSQRG